MFANDWVYEKVCFQITTTADNNTKLYIKNDKH